MKLTKTIRHAFMASVLTNEVKAPDFPALTAATWKEIISPMMTVAVAAIYNDSNATKWVSEYHIGELRHEAERRRARGDLTKAQAAAFAKLDKIEEMREKHQRNLDNIRDAISTAAESVTTVAGLGKLLPQYAKYLPSDKGRPSGLEAQVAIAGLPAAIETASAASRGPRARVRRPRAKKA